MNIGIDIDGVLTNMYEAIIDYGTKFCFENNINYKIESDYYYEGKILGISDENVEKFWNSYLAEYAIKFKPRKYASEVIKKIKENNRIFIITARNEQGLEKDMYGKMQILVKEWLSNNDIIYNKLIFSNESKLKVCVENEIDIMIEDSPKNINELADKMKVFCFDNPYNKNIQGSNIVRVYSWYDILKNI